MLTVQLDVPPLRDPSLVADVILGAACRLREPAALRCLCGAAELARRGARGVVLTAPAESLGLVARACRIEAHALELGRRSLRDLVPDNGPGEGELFLLAIALGCEAAATREAA